MPKQTVNINFAQGLNTKTDPWQVPVGQFANLQNSIFQKGGLLQKRNGYGSLTGISENNAYLTTLNDNLISIGNTVSAYSESLDDWITKGNLQPCSINTLPLIRNNKNQTQSDTAIANGLILTVYKEQNQTLSTNVINHLYSLADVNTGQNIIEPTSIPVIGGGVISGSSRVFIVGSYFVVVSQVVISSTTYLQYFSISATNPVASAAQNVTSEVYSTISANPGWDAVSYNGTLVIAYNSTTTAQGVHVASLIESQIAANSASSVIHQFNNAAYIGALVSLCVDVTANPAIFYISFWNNSTTNGYTCAVNVSFGSITTVFSPQLSISSVATANIASSAQNGVCTLFSETVNAYGYDSSIPTNFISSVTISNNGSVGSPGVVIRSVGLASKSFIVNGTIYFLSTYSSPYQPTYFLINGSLSTSASPVIVAKLAYENGGGYVSNGLHSVSVNSNVASMSYLYKDLVESLNTLDNTQQTTTGGIYSQTGINLANFTIGTNKIDTAEIGGSLHVSGGYLGMFDGYLPVEHNFFLWPDSVELTYTETSTKSPTASFSSGVTSFTVSSATGISVGMSIADSTNPTYIPANTFITFISGTTVTISNPTTHSASGDTLTIQGNIAAVPNGGGSAGSGNYYYQSVYSWTDNNGLVYRSAPSIPVTYTTIGSGTVGSVVINTPTLRMTQKVANPIKIEIYRWSVETQVYNQVTSILAPLLNDTTVDSVSFTDNLSDAMIVGNSIIYTTGGVVEDVNAPSSNIMTLFDTRLWLVDAEDPNTLWLSKQVIEGTPVEMSDLFTIYIAPNTGTVSSTGPITALAPMDDKLIIFKNNSIFYINGVGPNNLGTTANGSPLGNYSQPIFITSVVGCVNQQSIVLTQDGLMFQSDKGIWLLSRGLQTSYIGAPVESYNNSVVNSACVIPGTNYVLFTLDTGQYLMYDYYFQQWGTFVGNPATSSCIYKGLHTVLNSYGNILQETQGQYLDGLNPVLMSFTTSWFNLASLQGYERFYDFYVLAKYLSPHNLIVQVAYDYNPSIVNQTTISPNNFSSSVPGPFGIPTPFGSPGYLEEWRVHAERQKCESFQLTIEEQFNPAYGTIAGAGFTMSGITCRILTKKGTRPITGMDSVGLSR